MSFVHCMICFSFPTKDIKFYFSSCAHVACVRCVEKGCFLLKCKICQKENPQIVEINRQLKPEIAELFTPMDASLQKMQTDLGKILEFQSMHRNRLVDQLSGKAEMFGKLKDYCQAEIKKKEDYKQECMKLSAYKKQADATIEKLKAQINSSHSNNNNLSNNTASSNMNLTTMTHDPFRTPAPRGGHRSFITSTPLPDAPFADKSSMDESLSFSAATGLPKGNDTTGEVSMLAKRAEHVNLNDSVPMSSGGGPSGGKKRGGGGVTNQNDSAVSSTTQPVFKTPMNKAPAVKKTRLDILSKSQPLPLK